MNKPVENICVDMMREIVPRYSSNITSLIEHSSHRHMITIVSKMPNHETVEETESN